MSDRVEMLLSKFRAIYDADKIDYVKVYYAGDGIMWLSSDDVKAIYDALEAQCWAKQESSALAVRNAMPYERTGEGES